MKIDLTPSHEEAIRNILKKHIPDTEVWAFGSRVRWTAKDTSDLDLVIASDEKTPSKVMTLLKLDFEDSELPFKVDVLDWQRISEEFQGIIKEEYVVFKDRKLDPSLRDWKNVSLRDITVHQKGFAFKSKDFVRKGNPIVKVKDFTTDSIDPNSLVFVNDDIFGKNKNVTIFHEDIIIATVGSWPNNPNSIVGKTVRVPHELDGALLNQNAVIIRPTNRNKNDNRYMYYVLKSKRFSHYLVSSAQGSANQASITLKDIYDYAIEWPSFKDRKKIGHFLYLLDEKIISNKKRNKILQSIVQTIFKSWFVDFDPIHAKKKALERGLSKDQAERAAMAIISGICSPSDFVENFKEMDQRLTQKLSKMSKEDQEELTHTAALFPSEFQDSELGEIPIGFSVKLVGEISNIVGGGTPSTKIKEYYCSSGLGTPWLSPKDLSNYPWKFIKNGATDITDIGLKKSSAKLMLQGTVVVSSRAPIGYIAIAEGDLSTNQGFKSLVPKENIGTNFLYNWAKLNIHTMEAVATGSTFKEISGKNMSNLKIIVPNPKIIRSFEEKVGPLSEFQKNLRYETETLENLRDTLLPKLLTGEVDLSNIKLDENVESA